MTRGKKKIFVAMSGGVDSSTAAALLKREGHDITGVFVKGWMPEAMVCGWKEERQDALRAAGRLGIPFLTYDFSREYENKIVDYMKKEYMAGRTPNPDVMCNKYIKFGFFLEKSLKLGADCIATGHYVRLKLKEVELPSAEGSSTSFKLLQAEDKNKDQSYFLWTLAQEQLKYCLFPIGNYKKPEVRKMAKKFGLTAAEKKDSQGLCFVGDINFSLFLRNILPKKEGDIKTADGKIIGRHDGVQFYTLGQRHGLNLPAKYPYYVVSKDLKNNVLIVAEKEDEKNFYKKEIVIAEVNWISNSSNSAYAEFDELLKRRNSLSARIRYRQPLQKCRIISAGADSATIRFEKPQRAATPGQSLVLYKNQEMLGGGIII